jgi:hypothetical protein
MANWVGEIIDVQGAFLHGQFNYGKTMHMEVPQGFEKHCDPMCCVLLLLKTICGLKQLAFHFWKAILLCFASIGFTRSKADPCLCYKWSKTGLVLWVSWIDDCLVLGTKEEVKSAQKQMTDHFDCDVLVTWMNMLGVISYAMSKSAGESLLNLCYYRVSKFN